MKKKSAIFSGIAPVYKGKKIVGCYTSEGREYKTVPDGDFYTVDEWDIASLVSSREVSGDDWTVYLSGASPILAMTSDGKKKIRSLHRLRCYELSGRPKEPEDRASSAEAFGMALHAAQESVGIKPGSGLTSCVTQLAPGLRKIRRHAGVDILYRKELLRGGRVEIFKRKADEPTTSYDMKSAYVASYTKGLPGAFETRSKKAPYGKPFFALCTVHIPEWEHIPLAPFKAPTSGLLLFPVGRFTVWLASPEFYELERRGHIESVKEVHVYETCSPLDDFVSKVYQARQSAKGQIAKTFYKTLLVSAYGVFASSPSFPVWSVRPSKMPEGGIMLSPGMYQVEKKPRFSASHIPAACFITSYIRARLGAALAITEPYQATVDCLTIPSRHVLPTGDSPGDWSVSSVNDPGSSFIKPNTYMLGNGAILKASGVPEHVRKSYLEGDEVSFEKSLSPLSLFTSGRKESLMVTMRISGDNGLEKRFIEEDGINTRPLHIDEAVML